MKPANILLRFALPLVIFSSYIPSSLHAQDELLDKMVELKVSRQKLENVLEQLCREGGFYFSYKSSILKKDRLVTLTLSESTLREALTKVLGKQYEFIETGDYVVICKKDFTKKYTWGGPEMLHKKKLTQGTSSSTKEESEETVRHIIEDMVNEKIIASKDSFSWFGLDNGQFVVDGKAVSDSLHAIFRARYIKPDGMGYYYGPIKITGKGYFLDKTDLN
jgi:hypothetical protein